MRVHLLGICGTAMAALAGSLQQMGHRVTGTDEHVYPPMSDHLAALGIRFAEGYGPENIPPDADLVVVGNVIRESNPEAAEMRRRGIPYVSMAEAVNRFAIAGRHAVAIVGTHGKTTTTALLAHTLVETGADPGFLIGGIARNFNSNFRVGQGATFVVEGDEYDTAYFDKTPKFFKYHPRTLLFTSLEFDHADIYPNLEAIRVQFAKLLAGLPADGLLIACADEPNVAGLLGEAPCPVIRYGFSAAAQFRLSDWQPVEQGARFTSHGQGGAAEWRIPLAGQYNALNAAAVIVASRHLGVDDAAIQRALHAFQGVKRRQEVRGEVNGILVIDDFAHHPTAIRVTIDGMRQRYAGRRLWAVFEPRSFTARSAIFRDRFPPAFLGAHHTLLAPAFASTVSAGVERLDSGSVAAEIRKLGGNADAPAGTQAIVDRLAADARPGDVILVMSNGGFEGLIDRLLATLTQRHAAAQQGTPQRSASA
jgi:UDP-N-acetylmuramate: L-alanyl-gamma-D-glutamyl-meso-diaminopimelate ligase